MATGNPGQPKPTVTAAAKRAKEMQDEAERRAAEQQKFAAYRQPTRAARLAAQHQGRTEE